MGAGEFGNNVMTFGYLGRFAAGLFLCAALAGGANAAVRYEFEFFEFSPNGRDVEDFGIVLETPDYITVSGMNPLVGDPLPTPLGYDVLNVGTNKTAWFLFSNAGGDIWDLGATYSDTSFLFLPFGLGTGGDYIRAPGVVQGRVIGRAEGSFLGLARLTVTETLAVPEPGTWALMIVGFGLAGARLRRRSAATVAA